MVREELCVSKRESTCLKSSASKSDFLTQIDVKRHVGDLGTKGTLDIDFLGHFPRSKQKRLR